MNRRLPLAFLFGALVLNGGCGGSSTPSSPSAPAPTPVPAPVTTTVTTGAGAICPFCTGPITDFSVGAAGTVAATLRWTFASSDIDVWVLNGTTCSTHSNGVPSGAGCSIACQDVSVGGTTATCSFTAAAGNYRLWFTNYGTQNESGTYIVTLTR